MVARHLTNDARRPCFFELGEVLSELATGRARLILDSEPNHIWGLGKARLQHHAVGRAVLARR